jgi:phenylacetate-CoA ligase
MAACVCLDSALDATQRAAAVAGVQGRLREILDQRLMNNVTFAVVVVDDIPVNPRSRKFQLIVAARTP